jgi:hypothetical protein
MFSFLNAYYGSIDKRRLILGVKFH